MATDVYQELGIFINNKYEIDLDTMFYTLEGPTGNLYQDAEDGLIGMHEIVPHRALDVPWEPYICEEGKTPHNDPDEKCAAYFASLNN